MQHRPYKDAPVNLQQLIGELRQRGDVLVYEDEDQQAVAYILPASESLAARRDAAAEKMRELLDSLPQTSPYSLEETLSDIENALTALREEGQQQAVS